MLEVTDNRFVRSVLSQIDNGHRPTKKQKKVLRQIEKETIYAADVKEMDGHLTSIASEEILCEWPKPDVPF
jgi:hypothetical protein